MSRFLDAVCAKDILPYEIRKYCASTPRKQFSEFKLLEGDAMKTQHGICDEMMVDGNTVIACTCAMEPILLLHQLQSYS